MSLHQWDQEESHNDADERDEDERKAGATGDLFIFAGLAALYLLLVVFLLDVLQI